MIETYLKIIHLIIAVCLVITIYFIHKIFRTDKELLRATVFNRPYTILTFGEYTALVVILLLISNVVHLYVHHYQHASALGMTIGDLLLLVLSIVIMLGAYQFWKVIRRKTMENNIKSIKN